MISGEQSSKEPFRELLGALLFVAICTRPDVAFTVAILCKYTQQAGREQWEWAMQVLMYLYGTRQMGITYRPGSAEEAGGTVEVEGQADADHGTTDAKKRAI